MKIRPRFAALVFLLAFGGPSTWAQVPAAPRALSRPAATPPPPIANVPQAKGSQRRSYLFAPAQKEMPYRLYVPARWSARTPLPLILFLHGGGSDENAYLDRNDRQLEKLAEKHGYIVVAPLGYTPIGSYGTPMTLRGSFGNPEGQAEDRRRATPERLAEIDLSEKDTIAVLDRTVAEYNVDPKRVFLAGHSMGAGGGWYLAGKYPGRFAALGLLSGPLIEETVTPVTSLKGIPIEYSEGTQAPSLAASRKLYEAAQRAGVDMRYREFDADHGGMIPLALPGVFEFFDAQRPTAIGAAPAGAVDPAPRIAGLRSLMGTLADGTAYRVDVPEGWNGAALFNLDYASPMAPYSEQSRLLLTRGYALAGVTRAVTGWRVPLAVDNLTEVKRRFETEFGRIRQPIAFGGSMGGHTVFIGAHRRPSPWVAGVGNCAGPAGAVAQWNEKLDALFVAKTLLAPDSPLPIIDVPADFEVTATPAWKSVLEQAQKTPEGRARIALAAVLGGLPDWASMARPRPASTDYDAREEGYYEALAGGRLAAVAQFMSSRRQINTLYGGNISWNTGIDYRAALNRLPEKKLVEGLYRRAGLDLAADLASLARAPRVSEQPEALRAIAEQQYFGDLSIPVISLQGIGDPISASDAMDAISRGARSAGKAPLLRTVFTETAGHCTFSPGEIAAVVDVVKQRLDTGRWPDTSPASLNALSKRLAPAEPARFIDFKPNVFTRLLTPQEFERRAAGAGKD